VIKVRDYTQYQAIMKAVDDAREAIIACWDDWEREAEQEAQREQNNDAWFSFMNAQLDEVLTGMLDNIEVTDLARADQGGAT
jgi:hypothetical protein